MCLLVLLLGPFITLLNCIFEQGLFLMLDIIVFSEYPELENILHSKNDSRISWFRHYFLPKMRGRRKKQLWHVVATHHTNSTPKSKLGHSPKDKCAQSFSIGKVSKDSTFEQHHMHVCEPNGATISQF